MTTLVTGGRGFTGRYIVERLISRGEPVISYNRDFSIDEREGVTAIQGELFDVPRLVTTLKKYQVDRIIHTAGMSHPELSIDLPITTFSANVDGTLKVFESAKMADVRRVVNFSSEVVYGNLSEDVSVTEETRLEPTTPYGVTKVTGELLGKVYNELYEMQIVSLRITEVYGPGLWMPSLLADMCAAVVRGDPFELANGADHHLQFINAADVALAADLASTTTTLSQPAYNISGGEHVTVGHTAELLRSLVPGAVIKIGSGHIPRWDRTGRFDISAAERDFGYTPQRPLNEGIADYVKWLQKSLQSQPISGS